MPQELQSREEAILLATEELSRATQDLAWSEKLAEKGFLEQAQLDADRLGKTRAEVTLSQAVRAKALFSSYEIPRRRQELQAAVVEKTRELERVKLQATARIADFEANLRSAEATAKLETDDLDKMLSQIEKATIRAPVAGMVVYAVESRGRWGSGDPMQEGTTVRERQDIITIPSSQGFIAEASLHESVLEKVQVGMSCLVTVDALRQSFQGRVHFKAVLPDQGSFWANPDLRVYRTEIKLLSFDPRLRPGMSCSIEILVDELVDVLYVPVQAVFLDAGETVCLVPRAGGTEKRPVEVGQNNGKWVEIHSGVSQGEVVLLARPAGVTLAPSPERTGEAEDAGPFEPPDGGPDRDGQGPRNERGDRGGDSGGERGGGPAGGNPGAEGASWNGASGEGGGSAGTSGTSGAGDSGTGDG
jgi:HlyD family secretion protein